MSTNTEFKQLKEIVHQLRDPEKGCPWDKVQTHETLKPYLIEESYEVMEAIDFRDATDIKNDHLKDELGDILYQVFIHAELAEERTEFSIEDVAQNLIDKLIRRHPHVFGTTEVSGVDDVLKNWDAIKKTEKGNKRESILDGIPKSLPSLMKAQKIGEKVAKVGFDWDDTDGILEKLQEELTEFKEAKDAAHIEEELGDLLFVIAQWGRKKNFNLELCLERANTKFERRFKDMEKSSDKPLKERPRGDLEELWQQAKQKGL